MGGCLRRIRRYLENWRDQDHKERIYKGASKTFRISNGTSTAKLILIHKKRSMQEETREVNRNISGSAEMTNLTEFRARGDGSSSERRSLIGVDDEFKNPILTGETREIDIVEGQKITVVSEDNGSYIQVETFPSLKDRDGEGRVYIDHRFGISSRRLVAGHNFLFAVENSQSTDSRRSAKVIKVKYAPTYCGRCKSSVTAVCDGHQYDLKTRKIL